MLFVSDSEVTPVFGGDDLFDLLGMESLVAHFQPILSLKSHSVVGYEGLVRGVRSDATGMVPPSTIFETARKKGRLIQLDRLCRTVILDGYREIQQEGTDTLLFLNFESSLLNSVAPGNGHLLEQVAKRGINPSNIVIEIVESHVRRTVNLIDFVDFYRSKGFLIALDDVGAGYSNFDRIVAIRPDILKVDRSIVKDLEKDYYKQEVFKSLGNLARKTGTLILAEGIETEEEALCAMGLNADLAQGYLFARPQLHDPKIDGQARQAVSRLKDSFSHRKIREIGRAKERHGLYDAAVRHILEELVDRTDRDFNEVLRELVGRSSCVEALYILDDRGIQRTDTVLRGPSTTRNRIFHSAKRGDDLSLKEYFYLPVSLGLPKYTTESYISLATGNLCRTIAVPFTGPDERLYVLCVDVAEPGG